MSQVISSWTFDPGNTLFKQDKATPCSGTQITCSNTQSCELFSKGQCLLHNVRLFKGYFCPYGKRTTEYGMSRRSKKYYGSLSKLKEKYPHVAINDAPEKLARVGDFIYLPYTHMDMFEGAPWNPKPFIKVEEFTLELVTKLINFRPQSLFGGEITSYQLEVIPKFAIHLREAFPEIFYKIKFSESFLQKITNVGRKALVKTLNPCKIVGDKESWEWDGENLTTNSGGLFLGSVFANRDKKFESVKVICKPSDSLSVKVTNESQVNENTKFVD